MIVNSVSVRMDEGRLYDVEICGYTDHEEIKILREMHNKVINFTPRVTSKDIKKVIFNGPATIVLWKDGTKTVVKCQDGETFDKEKGLAMCIVKKVLGNKGNYNNIFKKHIQ